MGSDRIASKDLERRVFRELVLLQDQHRDRDLSLLDSYLRTAQRFQLTVGHVRAIADKGVLFGWLDDDAMLALDAGDGGYRSDDAPLIMPRSTRSGVDL